MYAPSFVEDWWNSRIESKVINTKLLDGLRFQKTFELEIMDKMTQYK
ncbi:hypothetical protein ACE193_09065 [Bernardetia sp. OM2101]